MLFLPSKLILNSPASVFKKLANAYILALVIKSPVSISILYLFILKDFKIFKPVFEGILLVFLMLDPFLPALLSAGFLL